MTVWLCPKSYLIQMTELTSGLSKHNTQLTKVHTGSCNSQHPFLQAPLTQDQSRVGESWYTLHKLTSAQLQGQKTITVDMPINVFHLPGYRESGTCWKPVKFRMSRIFLKILRFTFSLSCVTHLRRSTTQQCKQGQPKDKPALWKTD